MSNYKMIIQYDGTRYKGWQGQNSTDMTIEGRIEAVLSAMAGYPVELTGSGRTDAGVHARGQVANYHLDTPCDTSEMLSYVNQYLPDDIAVLSIESVDERFHSRYNATAKTYRYSIRTGGIPDVFAHRFQYEYDKPLDVHRMEAAAAQLVGTHDFASFCGNRKMKKSTVRTIYDIKITSSGPDITIDYRGSGFLQNMVRILTGTLIEVGDGRLAPSAIPEILAARDRAAAGYTAPACGLTLMEVEYGEEKEN